MRRIRKRNAALKRVAELDLKSDACVVIHYSCESFYDKTDGRTPRVTSIAIRNLASAQTESFSIHKVAEQRHIEFTSIEQNYDSLEREMLDEFYNHLSRLKHCSWIHWNMRDINYGFAAIDHRYKVLGGTPTEIPEEKKFDLAKGLIDIFNSHYIEHPRLENLIKHNNIAAKDFLTGKAEAEAFESKDFIPLHQSTLRKVDLMAAIFEKLADGSLKTKAKWRDIYGLSPDSLVAYVKQHWIISAFGIASTIIASIAKIKGAF